MGRKVDLTGQRFGSWTVIEDSGKRVFRSVVWNCICDCGNTMEIRASSLKEKENNKCTCDRNKDLSGMRFGELAVLGKSNRTDARRRTFYECECTCGKNTTVRRDSLIDRTIRSCGCIKNKDLTGHRFGRLTVLGLAEDMGDYNKRYWRCKCECGNYSKVKTENLMSGNSNSCGCVRLEYLGKNHPNYNPNIPDEERFNRRGNDHKLWSRQVLSQNDYTCQICSQHGGNLNAHHLNGWNAFPEQRFDLDNGVTLCVDCHKDFHKMYGRGDNTREQFNEYAASKTLVLN